jgi:hypothetical protein
MPLILILSGNFVVFILSLIGAQASYFGKSWKWFVLAVICVLISGACIFAELAQWLIPPLHESTVVMRQPTTPL